MSKLLNVSSSPHVRCGVSTKNLMYDVAIAMLPATIWGVMQFGIYSLIVVVATVLSCVLSEYLFETLMHKPVTISDGSALVTGMILGFERRKRSCTRNCVCYRVCELCHSLCKGDQHKASRCQSRVHPVLTNSAVKLFYDDDFEYTAKDRHP